MHELDASRSACADLLAQGQVQAHMQEGIGAARLDREIAGLRIRRFQQRVVFRVQRHHRRRSARRAVSSGSPSRWRRHASTYRRRSSSRPELAKNMRGDSTGSGRRQRLGPEGALRGDHACVALRACAPGTHGGRAGSASDARAAGIRAASPSAASAPPPAASRRGARPVRLATRNTCVSTASVASPKATFSTTLAVLRPTPGRASSDARSCGTSPPCFSSSSRQVSMTFFALALNSPMWRMKGVRPCHAELQDCRRRTGLRIQPARGDVHALVGGLSGEDHRHQQLEGRAEFQLAAGLGIRRAQRRVQGVDALGLQCFRKSSCLETRRCPPTAGTRLRRLPWAPLAHSTMPSDTPKRILRGARFAIITT